LFYTTKLNAAKGGRDGVPHNPAETDPGRLRSEYFFPFADFLVDFPADPFALTFVFRIGIICRPSNLFFDVAFPLVKLALRFVPGALRNGFSPFARFDPRVARRNIGDVSLPRSAVRSKIQRRTAARVAK
jgi:hypothetical protein